MKKKHLNADPFRKSILKIIRVMKLATFILLAGFMQVSANIYSQTANIKLSVREIALNDVIKEIQKQTEFTFFFSPEDLNGVIVSELELEKASLETVLDLCLKGTGLEYEIIHKAVILKKSKENDAVGSSTGNPSVAQQQKKTITGKVKDVKGLSIPGASVVVKGTTTGIITDSDGNFSLTNIPDNSTLVFSFVGMKTQEVKLGTQKVVNVVLAEETIGIEEVVAVGYGTQKKSDLTGSVASFNTKALQEHPQPNIIQNLQGTVAGLNIAITGSNAEGSASATTIRGTNSITASNKPLIILDGIPFSGGWSELNPNDIQAIEILKDASSAAIYGARGSNGVILISTKKGKKEQMVVSYDGFMSMDESVNIPKLMDGDTFYKYKVEALKAANTTAITPSNPEPWMGAITATEDRMHKAGLSTDWLKLSLRNGFKQQHNASFRGSVGKTSYYVSLNYTDSKGVSLNDKFNRVGFRINFEQELTPWLKFSTNTQFGRYDRSGKGPEFSKAFLMNPLAEAYDANGNLRLSAWEDSSVSYARNPLSAINEKNSNISQKLITNNVFDVTIPFIKGLTYKLNTGYTSEFQKIDNYQGRDTYEGLNANGILSNSTNNSTDWILENILSYIRTFGKHSLFVTGLYSAQSTIEESNSVTGQNFGNDVMYYYQVSKAGVLSGTANYLKENHISQMLRVNYGYDSRYLLTLTTRRDGYSAFGENSKFGIFPSVALGWNVSNEKFYKGSALSNVLTNFKYRLSTGKNGNEAVSAYVTLPNLSSDNYLSDAKAPLYGYYPQRLASPNLGWESTRSINTGFDFGLFHDRIRGTFDTYWSNTSDLLLSRTIPSINGTNSLIGNIGKTKNNGFELQISSRNIQNKKFSWTTDFTMSHYKTQIVNIGLYDAAGNPIDDIASNWFIGQPVSVNYDYRITGIWQITDAANPNGKQNPDFQYSVPGYVKYDRKSATGDITPADKQIIGSRIPKFTAGMNNTFRYGNISLSVFLNSSYGVTARNSLKDVGNVSWRENQLDKEYWTPTNPINTYPKNDLNGSVNPLRAGFYESASFLRIQDIAMAYKFPEAITNRIKMQRLELYLNINNLATFTNWSGLDPEFIGSQRATPKTRSFLLGLRFDL
ncbi:MAG: TonB-dependent receptor [Prolixibacteraceae bacterium]